MRIVIDIPEETYNEVCWRGLSLCPRGKEELVKAIKKGTPLPKGHGRLIDADALDLENEVSMADDWKTAHEMANCVKYAPTIIEADKESEVEE